MADESSAVDGVDPNVPNVARMYDYYLGGKDNFAADRAAAEQILALFPDTRQAARENRAFLARAVQALVDAGIRQIVDLGSGLPTQGNVHEIAHRTAPDTRVAYVDYDAVVCAHGRALLADDNVAMVQGDVRDVDALLASPELRKLIDLDRPVAFLMLAVLHFVSDEAGAYDIVAKLREASAPGSYLVISHATDTPMSGTAQAREIYRNATASLSLRTFDEISRFFDGYELLEPGLVAPWQWRPGDEEIVGGEQPPVIGYAGVARLA
ncbi:SAM-dependent methyltransferase [Planomonospora alba]|uniref:SAM-dependent methyltransferase n=1 Tax=Planomonospora alba TaxID=161354 RepID=A0ABP6N5H9_9ACTN